MVGAGEPERPYPASAALPIRGALDEKLVLDVLVPLREG